MPQTQSPLIFNPPYALQMSTQPADREAEVHGEEHEPGKAELRGIHHRLPLDQEPGDGSDIRVALQ